MEGPGDTGLRSSEAWFRALVQDSVEFTLVIDANGSIVYVSPGVGRILGASLDHLIGRSVLDMVHPDDRDAVISRLVERVAGTLSDELIAEYRVQALDGSWRWLSIMGRNRLDDPAIAGILINGRDVTEQKQAQEALDRRGERSALLAHATSELLGATPEQVDDLVADLLARASKLVGADQTWILSYDGTWPADGSATAAVRHIWMSPGTEAPFVDGVVTVSDAFRAWFRTSMTSNGFAVMTPSSLPAGAGEERDSMLATGMLSSLVVPVFAGTRMAGFAGFSSATDRDWPGEDTEFLVTLASVAAVADERARVEQGLRRSESWFRSVVQNVSDVIMVFSAEGQVKYASPSIQDVLGVEPSEIVGRSWSEFIDGEDLARAVERNKTILAGTAGSTSERYTLRHVDGTVRVLAMRSMNRVDDPDVRGIVTVGRDVTEVERAHHELLGANDALNTHVAELNETSAMLQAALGELAAVRDDERRNLAGDLHDRILQLLLATRWALDPEDGPGAPLTEAAIEETRAGLEAAIQDLRSLIVELRPPALDLLGVEAVIRQRLEWLHDQTGMVTSLQSDLEERLPAPLEILTYRVVDEALQNVSQHAQATTARVELRVDGHVLVVVVADDGIGFDEGEARNGALVGALGVVSIRESVRRAGGTVTFTRGPHGGTTVEALFPLSVPATLP